MSSEQAINLRAEPLDLKNRKVERRFKWLFLGMTVLLILPVLMILSLLVLSLIHI